MNKKDLSIIIVSYNTADVTKNCINSVYQNVKKISFEVIAVDNGSSDSSLTMLEGFCKKYRNFNLVINSKNVGFSKAVNKCIKISQGKYLLLLNSDTVVKKCSVEKLIGFAESGKDVGVAGPKLLNKDGTVQSSVLGFPTVKNAIKKYFFGRENAFGKYSPKTERPISVDAVVGAAFLITPKALEKVGLFDEKYFFYYEDLDYCRRINASGLKVYFYPDSEMIHLHGASGKNISDPSNQWRRLIPSSVAYHGYFYHYLLTLVLWLGQKRQKLSYKNIKVF